MIATATGTDGYIAAWSELVSAEFARGAAPVLRPRTAGDPAASGRVQVTGPDGTVHHLVLQAVTVGDAAACRVIVSVLDVTAEVATVGAHNRLTQVVDGVDDLVIVTTADGTRHTRGLDIAPGFPGRPLSDAQHRARFADCMAYAPRPLAPGRQTALLDGIEQVAGLADARELLALLVVR